MQALEADFVHNLVMKNKKLQKKLEEVEQNQNIQYNEIDFVKITKEAFSQVLEEKTK